MLMKIGKYIKKIGKYLIKKIIKITIIYFIMKTCFFIPKSSYQLE